MILSCCDSTLREAVGYDIHDLEQILIRTEPRRWRWLPLKVFFGRFRTVRKWHPQISGAYATTLWKAVVKIHWADFVSDLESFDPDVIDLRWMPRNVGLGRKLEVEMKDRLIISDGTQCSRQEVDTSWRRYDPNMKVSIVLPVYNGARFLRASLESCLAQSHRNIEVVIVDDCSTDETPDIVTEFARLDRRIISLRNDQNLRLPRALNVGFARASGEFLSWTSHDNYYGPRAIEALVRELCTWDKAGVVYSAFQYIDEDGQIDPNIAYLPHPSNLPHVNTVGPCFLYRREVQERIGGYREEMEFYEDYDYWLRASRYFAMRRLHFPLYFYRRHPQTMSAYYLDHLKSRRRGIQRGNRGVFTRQPLRQDDTTAGKILQVRS